MRTSPERPAISRMPHIALLLLGFCLCPPLLAQERPPFLDPGLALSVEADAAELSQDRNTSIYRGNVVLRRGPLEMRGHTLTVSRDTGNGQIRAALDGNPARADYSSDDPDVAPVTATAESIRYTTGSEILELKGGAEIARGNDRLQGESVRYEIPLARIQAEGGRDRVRITIQPPEATPQPGTAP